MTDKEEARGRTTGIVIFGVLIVIFIVISGISFAGGRDRSDPNTFVFQGNSAVEGKRVFQSYDCMGCHTMLGNGAYFAPDLTKVYEDGGSAWLLAFLSSPGTWPTEQVLNIRVQQLIQSGDLDVASLEEYYARYPHVQEAIELFAGKRTVMPNLALKPGEIPAMTAFFIYTAEINTAGWPPARIADASVIEKLQARYGVLLPTPDVQVISPVASPVALAAQGEQLASSFGCLACHSIDGSKAVGPTWLGLSGATVTLADGSTVTAGDAYLRESILTPDLKVVQGFSPGMMPSYEGQLLPADFDALIAFISGLK